MRDKNRSRPKPSLFVWLSRIIIVIGILALVTPYVMRYLYYQSSVVLALQTEDRLGTFSNAYEQVDYAQLPMASPFAYTPEEIDAAQQGLGFLDDLTGLGDVGDSIDQSISENAYLLAIPAINLKISVIRCKSFANIYRCMRLGAAIFPGAPEPNEIGNICMSAHRTGSRNYFRNLDKLSTGDVIYLHYADNISYQYQVVNVSIIEPDDWSVTGQTLYPALTLLSCQEYQGVSSGRRIMVRAKLVGTSKQAGI